MDIEIIKSPAGFEALKDEWRRFLTECPNDDFFLSYSWLHTSLKGLPSESEPFFFIFRKGGKIVGAAPLCITKGKVTTPGGINLPIIINRLHFITDHLSPRYDLPFIGNPEPVLRLFTDYLRNNTAQWGFLELRQIPDSSPNLGLLQETLEKAGFFVSTVEDSACPYRHFNGTSNPKYPQFPPAYSKRLNRLINKGMKELNSYGKVELKISTESKSWREIKESMVEIEQESWKHREKHRLFSPDMNDFTTELISTAEEDGELLVICLEIDNEPIAYNAGFIYRGKFYSYSCAYKEKFARHKPGYILHREAIKIMYEMNMTEHDFLMGNSRYKRSFCESVRQNYVIRAFHDHPLSKLLYGLYTGVRPIYRQIKETLIANSTNGSQ